VTAWLGVALYVLAILGTLPLTPLLWNTVSPHIPSPYLFSVLTAVVLPFVVLIAATAGRRGGRGCQPRAVAALVLLTAFSLVTVARLAQTPVELFHLLEYGGLSYLCLRASGRPTRRRYALCFLVVLVVAGVDEGIQSLLPTRVSQFRDVVLNALCGAIGLAAAAIQRPWDGSPPTPEPP